MNDYQINLTATKPEQHLFTYGRGCWYVEGSSSTAENRIKVKMNSGAEFALKPGQAVFNLPESDSFHISSFDGTSDIKGVIKIGSGNFTDSNIFSLTTLSPGAKVGVTGEVEVNQKPKAITGSYAGIDALAANTNLQLVAPSANMNGLIIHNAHLIWSGAGRQSFLANANAPAHIYDGIVILSQDYYSSTMQRDVMLMSSILIGAGKGLWYRVVGDPNGTFRNIHYTVL